jgi:hypothetical protein
MLLGSDWPATALVRLSHWSVSFSLKLLLDFDWLSQVAKRRCLVWRLSGWARLGLAAYIFLILKLKQTITI